MVNTIVNKKRKRKVKKLDCSTYQYLHTQIYQIYFTNCVALSDKYHKESSNAVFYDLLSCVVWISGKQQNIYLVSGAQLLHKEVTFTVDYISCMKNLYSRWTLFLNFFVMFMGLFHFFCVILYYHFSWSLMVLIWQCNTICKINLNCT